MQHTYEFIADLMNGEAVRAFYKGKTSRMKKVDELIRKDLKAVYGYEPTDIKGIKMRKI